jgi:hypothetical protein
MLEESIISYCTSKIIISDNGILQKDSKTVKKLKLTVSTFDSIDISAIFPYINNNIHKESSLIDNCTVNTLNSENDNRPPLIANNIPSISDSKHYDLLDNNDETNIDYARTPITVSSLESYGGAREILLSLQSMPSYQNQFCCQPYRKCGKKAIYYKLHSETTVGELSNILVSALHDIGKDIRNSLYLHQATAIDALRCGSHVSVSTATASGMHLDITYNDYGNYLCMYC